jgi:hypothetical protein
MSTYRRAIVRLAVLATLAFAAVSLTAPKASALTCQQTCLQQDQACNAICTANPRQMGCREECLSNYEDCLAGC